MLEVRAFDFDCMLGSKVLLRLALHFGSNSKKSVSPLFWRQMFSTVRYNSSSELCGFCPEKMAVSAASICFHDCSKYASGPVCDDFFRFLTTNFLAPI